MSPFVIFICSAAFIAVAIALVAFINTPDEHKFGWPKYTKRTGPGYAPEYTAKEKRRQLLRALLWVIPIFAVLNFWGMPWFQQYLMLAHCDIYGSFTGFHLVLYGLFVFAPVVLAISLFAFLGLGFIKVIQVGQYPLPGKKVSRPVKYVYGWRARLVAAVFFTMVIMLVGLGCWGYFAANEFISATEPGWPACSN